MAIDEMQIKNEEEEKYFDEEKEDDRCSCCGLPFDQCSWGKPDEWDDDENDDDSQINDPNYRPEEDTYSYSDSDSDSEV